jgi:hypothetical protein
MSRPTRFWLQILALWLFSATSASVAGEVRLPLTGWGTLVLNVPNDWRSEVRLKPIPTISVAPASGKSFEVLISPFTSPNGSIPPATPASLKGQAEANVNYLRAQAAESVIAIHELPAGRVFGSYYSLTDRAPKPGEYKYMTQGLVSVDGWPVAFTVLNDGSTKALVETSLRMLQSARKE